MAFRDDYAGGAMEKDYFDFIKRIYSGVKVYETTDILSLKTEGKKRAWDLLQQILRLAEHELKIENTVANTQQRYSSSYIIGLSGWVSIPNTSEVREKVQSTCNVLHDLCELATADNGGPGGLSDVDKAFLTSHLQTAIRLLDASEAQPEQVELGLLSKLTQWLLERLKGRLSEAAEGTLNKAMEKAAEELHNLLLQFAEKQLAEIRVPL
jgi:hypothetical protein